MIGTCQQLKVPIGLAGTEVPNPLRQDFGVRCSGEVELPDTGW